MIKYYLINYSIFVNISTLSVISSYTKITATITIQHLLFNLFITKKNI